MAVLWKLEPCFSPTDSHAADLLEIVDGDVVRRVSLPRLDLSIYAAYTHLEASKRAGADLITHLITTTGHDYNTVQAALRRLTAMGVLDGGTSAMRGALN